MCGSKFAVVSTLRLVAPTAFVSLDKQSERLYQIAKATARCARSPNSVSCLPASDLRGDLRSLTSTEDLPVTHGLSDGDVWNVMIGLLLLLR